MSRVQLIVNLVLKAIALVMAVASVVVSILGSVTAETVITLLSIGLFALAVAALQQNKEVD